MATLQVRLQDLATRIATECKSIRTLLNGNAADLSALATTAKTNLVAAINELKSDLSTLESAGGAVINDASSDSSTQTWSIDKIIQELNDTAAAVKTELLGGAGTAYDTFKELQDLLEDDATAISAINTALSNRLRFDAAQSLSSPQKAQGCANLGAAALADTGTLDTNFVAVFETGLS